MFKKPIENIENITNLAVQPIAQSVLPFNKFDNFEEVFGNTDHLSISPKMFYQESAIDISLLPSWKEITRETKAQLVDILGQKIPYLIKIFDQLIKDTVTPHLLLKKIKDIPNLSTKAKEITPVLLDIALNCKQSIDKQILPVFTPYKLNELRKNLKIKIGFISKGSNRIHPHSTQNGTETLNRGFTQTVFIDVNDGQYDHNLINNQPVCATTSVINNISNIKEQAGKRWHLVTHKNADVDSSVSLALYIKALAKEINGDEEAVKQLKDYAETIDLGQFTKINFNQPNLAYLIDTLKTYLKNKDWLIYQLIYEIIDRIISGNLDPANLPAKNFNDMKIRIGKKSYLNLGEVINQYQKDHSIMLEDFYKEANIINLPNGDSFVYSKNLQLNKFQIYQLGIPVIFDGLTLCATQEWANNNREILINLRNKLDQAEDEVRYQMSLDNPQKYNNSYFLRTNQPRPGYNNSNPWVMGETGSQIIQPEGKNRSFLPSETIYQIVQTELGVNIM